MSLKWLCTNASPPFVTTRTQSALQLQTSGAPPTFNSQPQHHDSETSLPITFGASNPTINIRKSSFGLLWRPSPKLQALRKGLQGGELRQRAPDVYTSTAPAPLLGLPSRMRLHLPTHHHRPTRRRVRRHRPIPRKMALLPLPRDARTLLSLLLTP